MKTKNLVGRIAFILGAGCILLSLSGVPAWVHFSWEGCHHASGHDCRSCNQCQFLGSLTLQQPLPPIESLDLPVDRHAPLPAVPSERARSIRHLMPPCRASPA